MKELEGGENLSKITEVLKKHFIDSKKELWFRGQPNYEHELTPSLFRGQYDEVGMYDEFIRRFPEHSHNHKNIIEWLTLMQHYGLPTRLLDWSENLLVALFFCCNDEKDKDGAIFSFGYDRNHNFLAETGRTNQFLEVLIRLTKSQSKKELNKMMANPLINSLFRDFLPYKPPYKNPRIRQQQGCFTFHGGKFFNGEELIAVRKMETHGGNLIKIRITPDNKKSILEELKLLGIYEATLFPEMDYQAKQIKEIYKSIN